MVSCNLVYLKEAKTKAEGRRHPSPALPLLERADDLAGIRSARSHPALDATAWFRRDLIERHKLRFDPRVFPTFEDGHFANRFLLLNPDTEVAFLKNAVYRYRKRADGTSILDRAKQNPAWCLDALRYGYIDLLYQAQRIAGAVPYFIQRTVLYDILFRFDYLVDHPERVPVRGPAEWKEFFDLLKRIFAAIDQTTINIFDLAHWTEMHKVGLLGLMKNARRPITKVYVRQYDQPKGIMQFSYFSAEAHIKAIACINDEMVPMQFVSRRRSKFLDRDYVFEHFFWISLGPHDYVRVRLDGETCDLMCEAQHLGAMATFRELRRALEPQSIVPHRIPPKTISYLRRLAATPRAKSKYDACWLFLDRPSKADDNAEHLYRYLHSHGLTGKMFFVLKPDSPDWHRLKSEGFQLIPFASEEHQIALIQAKFVVSSQPDEFNRWPDRWLDSDMCRYRLIFLQHGVSKDDISRWLNTKPISRMLATTRAEYESIVDPQSDYRLSAKEVVLTGMPRHDRLWSMPKTRDDASRDAHVAQVSLGQKI